MRLPATTASPSSPIVYLAGGPGSSAIEALAGPRRGALDALRRAGDVILLDQRGTGRSKPSLRCPPGSRSIPDERALTRSALVEIIRAQAEECARHWRSRGVDLRGYHANEIADDVDALRAALGARSVSLVGTSYGTHLALATLRRHPGRVDRLVLAGVVGPDDSWPLPSLTDSAFAAIARQVDRAGGSLAARLDAVVARLDSAPAQGFAVARGRRRAVTVGGFDFLMAVAGRLGTTDGAQEIASMVAGAERGDLTEVASHSLLVRAPVSPISAMTYLTLCASGASPARARQIEQETSRSRFGPTLNLGLTACGSWGGSELDSIARAPLRSTVPALLISGTSDFTTPLENAERLLDGLPNGRHLVLQGGHHGAELLAGSASLWDRVVGFLQGRPTESGVFPLDRAEEAP